MSLQAGFLLRPTLRVMTTPTKKIARKFGNIRIPTKQLKKNCSNVQRCYLMDLKTSKCLCIIRLAKFWCNQKSLAECSRSNCATVDLRGSLLFQHSPQPLYGRRVMPQSDKKKLLDRQEIERSHRCGLFLCL